MQNNIDSPLYITDHLFFLIEDGNVLAWNYKTHEQYLLKKEYFSEILYISKNNKSKNDKICHELLQANLVTKNSMTLNEWGWDILSKIFHIGTKDVCSETEVTDHEKFSKVYLDLCATLKNDLPISFSEKQGDLIALPEPDITMFEKVSFFSVLKNRKTCRVFNSESINIKELSLILYYSFGLIHGNWEELEQNNLMQTGLRKASPSSGATHSEEAYVVAYRVDGLKQGLYHYRPQDHKLTHLNYGDFEKKVVEMNYKQFFSEGMAFGIYVTSRLEKIWWKYKHSRSYRAMLLDIGHVSQTFLTCSTAAGLQTWITGAFNDSEVESFLGIEECKESVILFLGAGKGTNQAIPQIIIKQLEKI